MSMRMPAVRLGTLVAAAAVLALAIGSFPTEARPQLATGGDVLSVAFGDAKALVSAALVHKADSYFHGGVDVECHGGHDHHEGECCEHCETDAPHRFWDDPWAAINRRVRAPEVDRHLQGAEAVELMPWFWASVRANPHNVEAWTAAWHVANETMKDPALAMRVVAEARRANPESLELMLCEARTVFAHGKGDALRARPLFRAVGEAAQARCGGDLSRLDENDRWMYAFSTNYLAECEKILKSAK